MVQSLTSTSAIGVTMPVSGIYQFLNVVSGRSYYGSACDLVRRECEHRKSLNGGYHRNRFLQRSWNKYGEKSFKFSVIEFVDDVNKLIEREQFWLDEAFSVEGNRPYNICRIAGSLLGTKRTPESVEKMASTKRGKPLSPEHRAKISNSQKGKVRTPEHEEKLAATRRGCKRSAEFCRKIGDAKRGRKQSAETIAKRVEKLVGRKMPVAHVERLRELHRSLTKEQVAEIVERRRAGESYVALAKEYGSTKDTIRNWCLKEGLEKVNLYLTKAQVTEIRHRRARGETYDDIAVAMGISKVTIWRKVGGRNALPEQILVTQSNLPDPNQLPLL